MPAPNWTQFYLNLKHQESRILEECAGERSKDWPGWGMEGNFPPSHLIAKSSTPHHNL